MQASGQQFRFLFVVLAETLDGQSKLSFQMLHSYIVEGSPSCAKLPGPIRVHPIITATNNDEHRKPECTSVARLGL